MTPTHEDPDFCRECGETVLSLDLTERQRLVANGSQMTVSAGARAARKRIKNTLKTLGHALAFNYINRHPGFEPFQHVDVVYAILYPTRAVADPDNFFPTVKAVVDGMTLAGLWPDDSSRYIRQRTYLQSGRLSGKRGVWRLEIHISPITEEES